MILTLSCNERFMYLYFIVLYNSFSKTVRLAISLYRTFIFTLRKVLCNLVFYSLKKQNDYKLTDSVSLFCTQTLQYSVD